MFHTLETFFQKKNKVERLRRKKLLMKYERYLQISHADGIMLEQVPQSSNSIPKLSLGFYFIVM